MSLRSEAKIYFTIMLLCFAYFLVAVILSCAFPCLSSHLLSTDQALDGVFLLANSLVAGVFASSLLAFLLTSVSFSVERARRALGVADGLQRVHCASQDALVEELPGELSVALNAEFDFNSLFYFEAVASGNSSIYTDSQNAVKDMRELYASIMFHVNTYRRHIIEGENCISSANSQFDESARLIQEAKYSLAMAEQELRRLQSESPDLLDLSERIRRGVRQSDKPFLIRRLLEKEILANGR